MPAEHTVRANKCYKSQRIFGTQKYETRYIREIIFGKRVYQTYWEITLDPETLPWRVTEEG
jgi:hypothetical protein